MGTSDLTPRRAGFVDQYLASGNATRSAVAAGYAEKCAHVTGSRLLRNAKVAATIAERADVDAEFVVRRLVHYAEHADKDADAIRALDLLGRHLGMWIDRHESMTIHPDTEQLREFSLDELRAMLAAAKAESAGLIEGEVRELPAATADTATRC